VEQGIPTITADDIKNVLIVFELGEVELDDRKAVVLHTANGSFDLMPGRALDVMGLPGAPIAKVFDGR
jgi:hypothetical protein